MSGYTGTGPSRAGFTSAIVEEATVTNVNMNNYTVDVVTRHTSKPYNDLQVASPYFHNENGEGIYVLPEVGAVCQVFCGSDTTPPFVLGFLAVPNVRTSEDDTPTRSTTEGGSTTDVSFKGRRPDLLPGDICMRTRDENFIVLRRGGILQLGATDLAQRFYIPINNFIKDFCENYSMDTLGGNLRWTVERQENDPSGDAPVSYVFHVNEHAQDDKASFRVRHFPVQGPEGDEKQVWEVVVAPKKINTATGEVEEPTYTMVVTMDGTKTEFVGASYSLRITGDYTVDVDGAVLVKSREGNAKLEAAQEARVKGARVVTDGETLLGGADAIQPAVLGNLLITYLTTLAVAAGADPPTPSLLSNKVKVSS